MIRNRKSSPPTPFLPDDSGYGSGFDRSKSIPQLWSSLSLLDVANSVKLGELLDNDANFASATAVECYESDGHAMGLSHIEPSLSSLEGLGFQQADSEIERYCLNEDNFQKRLSVWPATLPFIHRITILTDISDLQTAMATASIEPSCL